MKENEVFIPIHEYPIDNIPLDLKEYIKVYKPALNLVLGLGIKTVLSLGTSIYNLLTERLCDMDCKWLFFLADIGYDSTMFKPNQHIIELADNHPNAAITDIDKALLGWIHLCYCNIIVLEDLSIEHIWRQLLYTFIRFLHNFQSFEQRTGTTVDLSLPLDDAFVLASFLISYPLKSKSKLINLSEECVNELDIALSYRKKIYEALQEARKAEIEYVRDDENDSYWNSFISCVNQRSVEEERVVRLIYSTEGIDVKFREFEKYLKNISDTNSVIPEVGISLEILLQKIDERRLYARNYMWAKTDEGRIVQIDDSVIAVLAVPCSFNCVLIAYHAFLLKQNEEMLRYLITYLSVFIVRNLSQISDVTETLEHIDTIEGFLLFICNLIFDFFYSHNKAIISQSYNEILVEDALSGQNFKGDIMRLVKNKEREIILKNEAVLEALDSDIKCILGSKLLDSTSAEKIKEFESSVRSIVPYKIDENELVEQESCKRLIISINAIYILVKTIERSLPLGLFDEDKKEEIENAKRRLSKIEDYLVKNTYFNPDFFCFENQDLDMAEYRIKKGIDATNIEKMNSKLCNEYLFESFKVSIQELRSEKCNLDYEKASQIKNTLREKLKEYPDCETKEFVLNLIDQESEYLSNALMENHSGTDDFERMKAFICDYVGPSFSILPESTINALATAELLFSQYATPDFSSVNFDYSCISALYYQAVESMYNELLWTQYANNLNSIKENGDSFPYLLNNGKLPKNLIGYLPTKKPSNYMDGSIIASHLTMGSFKYLLYNATSKSSNNLCYFRAYFDKTFGFDNVANTSTEYRDYQNRIDELHKQIEISTPRRNAASHGQNAISLDECKKDKKIVLSDVESIRNNSLGLIKLFLSLYKD